LGKKTHIREFDILYSSGHRNELGDSSAARGWGNSRHLYCIFSSYTLINLSLMKNCWKGDLGSQVTPALQENLKGSRLHIIS